MLPKEIIEIVTDLLPAHGSDAVAPTVAHTVAHAVAHAAGSGHARPSTCALS